MDALEMEEVESLVESSQRKRLAAATRKNYAKKGTTAATTMKGDVLKRFVMMGGMIIFVIFLYINTTNDLTNSTLELEKSQSDLTSASVDVGVDADVDADVDVGGTGTFTVDDNDNEKENDIDNDNDNDTDENSSASIDDYYHHQIESSEDEETTIPTGRYLAAAYSKYATVVPLIDHPLPDTKTKLELAEEWGHWHFWDGEEKTRPKKNYLSKFPNKDIPADQFPKNAWQTDAVFVNHYLNDADKLIERTMEAIFSEYGHGRPLSPKKLTARQEMFHWNRLDLSSTTNPPQKYSRRGDRGNGGWTTNRSYDGLVRRLLHAMMTSDTFTVVMGGHSAAAAQGNHFRQSYMMQFHKVMAPVFARLGVKLITRNVGQGGLGTIQNGLGSGSIYGNNVDILMWDSGMTENCCHHHVDIFFRQGLMGGDRVPVIWGGPFDLLRMLHENADADVGEWGNASDGIIEVQNEKQAMAIPWAARYMKCNDKVAHLCKDEPRFCATCWIDRDDGIVPEKKQLGHPKGQVKWHPGWRVHQLKGRNLAFAVLQALQTAISIWSDQVADGPPLDDSFWHVTDYYNNIRNKVKNLDKSLGKCYEVEGTLPTRVCNTPLKARTQYTPRADFDKTSLTSIIKPAPDGTSPKNEKVPLYDGPDAFNPCRTIPEGEIDVFNIISGRRRRHLGEEMWDQSLSMMSPAVEQIETPKRQLTYTNRSLAAGITTGLGWEVWAEPEGYCDGTYNAVCGRSTDNDCVLYGHHDERGALIGNEYSGWLVMNLEDLTEGIIIIKIHTWHIESESTKTQGWTSVDGKEASRRLGEKTNTKQIPDEVPDEQSEVDVDLDEEEHRRNLKMRSYDTPDLPDNFQFEYAIDGDVTTLNKDQFLKQKQQLQRVVETLTLLDDPNFINERKGNKKKDVEIAIRMKGCGRDCTFGISHVYWA